jgi:HEAT repeat protein
MFSRDDNQLPNIDQLREDGDLTGLIDALIQVTDVGTRRKAAAAIGWHVEDVHSTAVMPLIQVFNDTDENATVRAAAADALSLIDSAGAVQMFIAALSDGAPEVRSAAAAALGRLSFTRATEPLVGAFEDEDARVRAEIAWSLGQIGVQLDDSALFARAVGTLISALEDENEYVRGAGAEALELITALRDDEILLARAIGPLVAILQDQGQEINIGSIAANALGNIGVAAAGPLVEALQHRDSNVRENAAWALSYIGADLADPVLRAHTLTLLTGCLEDVGEDVRRAAAYAVGKIGLRREPAGLQSLAIKRLGAMLRIKAPRLCQTVVAALESIGTPEARATVAAWRADQF